MSIGLDPGYDEFCCIGIGFGLQSASKGLGSGPGLDWVNGKELRLFFFKKVYFVIFDVTFFKRFGLWLDLDWVTEIQDWFRIVKYNSPLISATQAMLYQAAKDTFGTTKCKVESWLPDKCWCTVSFSIRQQCYTHLQHKLPSPRSYPERLKMSLSGILKNTCNLAIKHWKNLYSYVKTASHVGNIRRTYGEIKKDIY